MTREEIEKYIFDTYGAEAEYPWIKYPSNAVFRHSENKKWFALIMNIPREKPGLSDEGNIDIINLKCSPALIGSFLSDKGIFPAYHMSKTHWISAALDENTDDSQLKVLLDMSFENTAPVIKKNKASK